jgi:hypothetical protein
MVIPKQMEEVITLDVELEQDNSKKQPKMSQEKEAQLLDRFIGNLLQNI